MNNLVNFLPPRLTNNPAWREFAEAVDEFIQNNVLDHVQKLRNMKDPRAIEEEFLALLAADLGFDLKSSLFSKDDYRRITAALSTYYQQSGTAKTSSFLSFTNRSILGMEMKWTEDYVNFFDVPGGPTIYDGGTWFITPHVDVFYNGDLGTLPEDEIRSLFYAMAPIHLVLEKVVQLFTGYLEFAITGECRLSAKYTELSINTFDELLSTKITGLYSAGLV